MKGLARDDAPDLAGLAALIGDPARARMLTAVMSGTALTATELALEAGVAASTASAHLARLTEGQILAIEKQGRHRYFRLFDAEIAEMLEELMGIASRRGPRRRTGPADPALRVARVCYDHLAGERGVWLLDRLRERRLIDGFEVSGDAGPFFTRFGIDVSSLAKLRPSLPPLPRLERAPPPPRRRPRRSHSRPHLCPALGAAGTGWPGSRLLGWRRAVVEAVIRRVTRKLR